MLKPQNSSLFFFEKNIYILFLSTMFLVNETICILCFFFFLFPFPTIRASLNFIVSASNVWPSSQNIVSNVILSKYDNYTWNITLICSQFYLKISTMLYNEGCRNETKRNDRSIDQSFCSALPHIRNYYNLRSWDKFS